MNNKVDEEIQRLLNELDDIAQEFKDVPENFNKQPKSSLSDEINQKFEEDKQKTNEMIAKILKAREEKEKYLSTLTDEDRLNYYAKQSKAVQEDAKKLGIKTVYIDVEEDDDNGQR